METTEHARLIVAAEDALTRFAWDEARTLLDQALADHETPEALELLTRANRWIHDDPGTIGAGERAFALYRRRGDRFAAARVATWLAVDVLELRGQDAVANGWLRSAHRLLEGVPPAPEHGWLVGVEAYLALLGRNDAPAAIALADQALGIARGVGAGDVEMVALAVKGLALVTMGDVSQGMTLLDEACTAAIHEEIADPSARSTILCALMDACDRVRDFDRATQWCTLIRDASARWQLPAVTTVCRPHYAVVLAWRGMWAEAEEELTAAIAEYQEVRPLLVTEGIVRLAELRLRQGKVDEAVRLFTQVEHEGMAQVGRAELALALGDAATARDFGERRLRQLPESDLIERATVHEVLARAALAMGDLSRAMIAADELRTSADAIGTGPLRAAALHVAGQVAAQQGDAEHARALLEDAVDAFHRAGAPYETARARIDLGQVLLGLGDSGGCEAEWQAALTAFQTIGAAGDAARVMHQMGRSFGPVSTVSASRGTPSTALSEREVEILRLMARGLSNQEIADVLVISVRTVERHVSNIYLRIGVSGKTARASAVAHAYRLGLIVGR